MSSEQMRIYVAGPMMRGEFAHNMRIAIEAGHAILSHGHFPYIPHLTWHLHLYAPRPVEEWMMLDKVWLLQCNALLRLPGDSLGADIEVMWAEQNGLRIFTNTIQIPIVDPAERMPLPKYDPSVLTAPVFPLMPQTISG